MNSLFLFKNNRVLDTPSVLIYTQSMWCTNSILQSLRHSRIDTVNCDFMFPVYQL